MFTALAQAAEAFVRLHPGTCILIVVGWCIWSAAVSALPDITPQSSPYYVWFFRFSHFLAMNPKEFTKKITG